MDWMLEHLDDIGSLTLQHSWLAGLPLVVGLLVSLPLGWLAHRQPRLRGIVVVSAGLLYTVPSLALFVLMPLVLGTGILDPVNVVVAMTIYTVALLVRSVVDGLGSVPDEVTRSAVAMGYTPVRRFVGVDLPLAVPVIAAGLRVAAVSNVSIVSIASLIGVSQLGDLLVVGGAVGQGRREDRRVRGDTDDVVRLDELRQLVTGDHRTVEVVEPDGDARVGQGLGVGVLSHG